MKSDDYWLGSDAQRRVARTMDRRVDDKGFRRWYSTDDGFFYSPIRDLVEAGHGFIVTGPPPYKETRSDRRRSTYAQEVRWVLEHRPDVLTPAQAEALWLFHEESVDPADGPPISYCVDDHGRSAGRMSQDSRPLLEWARANDVHIAETTVKDVPRDVRDADDQWLDDASYAWHERHHHVYAPLSISQAARFLGVKVSAFRDRLKRAEHSAAEAWNHEALRRRGKPIPDFLTKYRRRRAKKGRAGEKG